MLLFSDDNYPERIPTRVAIFFTIRAFSVFSEDHSVLFLPSPTYFRLDAVSVSRHCPPSYTSWNIRPTAVRSNSRSVNSAGFTSQIPAYFQIARTVDPRHAERSECPVRVGNGSLFPSGRFENLWTVKPEKPINPMLKTAWVAERKEKK